MKVYFLLLTCWFSHFSTGQNNLQQHTANGETCGHGSILSIQNQNPFFIETLKGQNHAIQDYIEMNLGSDSSRAQSISQTATHVIPVVVHIVRDPSDPLGTIGYGQVESQIDALNAAFSKNYLAYNGQTHGPNATDTQIQFCLTQTPLGPSNWTVGSEPGVMRYNDALRAMNQMTITSTDDLLSLTHPSPNYFQFENHLNIWVVQSINGMCSGIQGYAVNPLMEQTGVYGFNIDGIVVRADAFGDNSTGNSFTLQPHNLYGTNCPTSYAVNNEGKVVVHEVGHYLNLFHTFQNDLQTGASCAGNTTQTCLTEGDYVCDTPPSSLSTTYICGSPNPNSCGTNDLIEDYMYYSMDPCQNTFTQGQADRMMAYLNLYRAELFTVENHVNTGIRGNFGCISPELIADFNHLSNNCINTAQVLNAYGSGVNTATSFSWTSSGGVIANPLAPNTTITFGTAGSYTVTLTVSDGVNQISSSQIISASNCQMNPEFIHQSQWYFGQYAQIDFSSGTATPTNIARLNQTVFSTEASYSYSDENGELVFYTDGINLWDHTHTQINISPIFPSGSVPWNSVTAMNQGVTSVHGLTAVPFPGHPNEYYLFCAPPDENGSPGEVKWTHLDLNNSTVTASQNLNSSGVWPGECLTIIPHCNGWDYWIITHDHYTEGDNFHTYLLTSLGLADELSSQSGFTYGVGAATELKASPNNDFLVLAGGPSPPNGWDEDIATYSFDNASGLISNELIYDHPGANDFVGCSFSRDGQQIYATSIAPAQIIQFDVSSGASTVISNTGIPVYLQLGPDDNLYVSIFSDDNHMGRILNPNTPNNLGAYDPNAIDFSTINPSGIKSFECVPNFIDGIQPDSIPLEINAVATSCLDFDFGLDSCWSIYDISWDFGDGSPITLGPNVSHSFPFSGDFQTTCSLSLLGLQDSIHIQRLLHINNGPITITGNNNSCLDNINPSSYNVPLDNGAYYTWSVSSEGTIVSPNGGSQIDVDWIFGSIGTVSINKTKGGCTLIDDMDITLEFCSLKMEETWNEFGFMVYPNPTSGIVNLEFSDYSGFSSVKIYNVLGQIISETFVNKNQLSLELGEATGVYYMELVKSSGHNQMVKVIKQ